MNWPKKFLCTVIGSQNTGKSTFINDVIEKYSNNQVYEPFITTQATYREIIKEKNLQINREGNLESQRIIFDNLVDQLVSAIRNPDMKNVIFDRSPIDALAYTVYLKDKGKIEQSAIEQMVEEMTRFVRMYDSIVYVPLSECENVKVVDDKFRDTDLVYRAYVDNLFRKAIDLLDDIDREKVVEIYGDREERVKMFYDLLANKFVMKEDWIKKDPYAI